MTYIRDMIFGRDLDLPKQPQVRGRFIALLVITLLFAAWHYGMITSAALVLRPVAIGIWDMLCDLAADCGNILQYIGSHRSQ